MDKKWLETNKIFFEATKGKQCKQNNNKINDGGETITALQEMLEEMEHLYSCYDITVLCCD